MMGCRDLRIVTLCNYSESWRFLNRLNEQRMGDAVDSRQWTVECQSHVERNLFDGFEAANLSNCRTLESFGHIGLLTSLKYLYLQNCRMLRTLPNLSGSCDLQVVDLSYCCMLKELGDIGPMRALQYLYLQNCRSLRSVRELESPCLKVLDLSGCSKLEDLGKFDSLSSLQTLNLRECVSLRGIPNLRNCCVLEVLDVKGCMELSGLLQMTTRNVVINISECWSLERIPILNDLSKLELDVSVGDRDRKGVALSGDVRGLILKCERDSLADGRSDELETLEQSIMDMLRLKEAQKQREGTMELLGSDRSPARERDFEIFSEIRLCGKAWKQEILRGMGMVGSRASWTRKHGIEGIVEVLRSEVGEAQAHGMNGSTKMLGYEDLEKLSEEVLNMLSKRLQRIVEILGCEGAETGIQYIMEMKSEELESWSLAIMNVFMYEESGKWRQAFVEMLRSVKLEVWKQFIIKTFRSEDIELWKQGITKMRGSKNFAMLKILEVPVISRDLPLAMIGRAPQNENGFVLIHSCGGDVRHFKDVKGVLDSSEWMRRRSVFPQPTHVKFSSVSVSSERLTYLPPSRFYSTVARLEIVKCRRLRLIPDLGALPALETLVISQCDELEILPDLGRSTALKHLTIHDFRKGPRFQFLSHLCEPLHAYPTTCMPYSIYTNLVELNFDSCVGLGGLEHWGPLPALESLVINNCNTITRLPNLQNSSKLSKVIVMNCGRLREAVNLGSEGALRVVRIEGCGNEKFTNTSSRYELCLELKNVLLRKFSRETSQELIDWLRRGKTDDHHLDMFSRLNFGRVEFTGPTLEKFNLLMKQWALRLPN